MDEGMRSGNNFGITQATKNRKTHLIGSIRNNNTNYPKDQKFFHASDIPEKAREVVREVKSEIDRDVFKLKKPKWNASVSKVNLPADDNDTANLFSIRKGFKDFHPLEVKPQQVYEGTDTRNTYYDGWNVSNQVPIPLHQQKMLAEK